MSLPINPFISTIMLISKQVCAHFPTEPGLLHLHWAFVQWHAYQWRNPEISWRINHTDPLRDVALTVSKTKNNIYIYICIYFRNFKCLSCSLHPVLSYAVSLMMLARNSNSMETLPCCNSSAGHQIAPNLLNQNRESSETKFPSNLNYDGKPVIEMDPVVGLWIIVTSNVWQNW